MSRESERAARLARVIAVQEQKRLLEEWRLAQYERRRGELDADDNAMLASMERANDLGGLSTGAAVRALRRNDTERRDTETRRQAAAERLVEIRRAAKGLERSRERSRRKAQSEAEARDLAERLESFLAHGGGGGASFE